MCHVKGKECVCVTVHAAGTNKPVALWRRQKLSDGKKFPTPRPRSHWTAALSPAHERYNCIPTSLSQESSPAVVSGPSICQDCGANKRNQGCLCQIPSRRRGGMERKKGKKPLFNVCYKYFRETDTH